MSIYTLENGLSSAVSESINTALRQHLTGREPDGLPGELMLQLMDGTPKVLVLEANVDLTRPYEDPFCPERGDGRLHLLRPDQPGYQKTGWDATIGRRNIRASVPLWIINRNFPFKEEPHCVLGVGAIHPRFSAATIAFCDPRTRKISGRFFFADPRTNLSDLKPHEQSEDEQMALISQAGGEVTDSGHAPVFRGYLPS